MADPARESDGTPAVFVRPARANVWLDFVRQGLSILLSATALAWLGRLLVTRDPVQGVWALQVMMSLAAFLAGCWGAVHRYRTWTLPMRKLQTLLGQASRGEISIDELSEITGGPRAIVPQIQELLRELRNQHGVLAELEIEMRQRVASRTDALERTIGSLRQQATRDSLTGLFNRRFLEQYLQQCVQRHLKEAKDMCLLMIDVDNFKILNDTLGHAAGDDLLKAVGQLIRSAIRGEDVGFRCGGDEFVVLLPHSSTEAGRALADRLTSLVDALARTLKVPKPPRLSIGLATLKQCQRRTPDALLSDADRALYEMKRARKAVRPEVTPEGLNASGGGVQSPLLSRKAGWPFPAQRSDFG
jgi:diguanylate cyclase (GGDEF)-like protein